MPGACDVRHAVAEPSRSCDSWGRMGQGARRALQSRWSTETASFHLYPDTRKAAPKAVPNGSPKTREDSGTAPRRRPHTHIHRGSSDKRDKRAAQSPERAAHACPRSPQPLSQPLDHFHSHQHAHPFAWDRPAALRHSAPLRATHTQPPAWLTCPCLEPFNQPSSAPEASDRIRYQP